jgi:nucleoside-diphosphate-sugar epimerase
MGGNRYIGLHLVFELARRGHDVTVMNSHEAPMPDGARRLHGDRQVPGTITEVLGPHRDEFDAVFDNTAYHVSDLEPMVELFAGRVQHFVFTSSVAVYRRSYVQPVDENARRHDPTDVDHRKAYGVGKVQCEDYLAALHRDTGLPATTLRVGHTLGPKSPLVTRDPIFFRRIELDRPTLIPGDGFPFIHLVHVNDVARLMASLLGNERAAGQAYNVLGREYASLTGIIQIIGRAMGRTPKTVSVPLDVARKCQPPLVHWGEAIMGGTVYSIEKALTDLDWEPEFGLEAGYRDSYEWFDREGRDRYDYDFSNEDALLAQLGANGR